MFFLPPKHVDNDLSSEGVRTAPCVCFRERRHIGNIRPARRTDRLSRFPRMAAARKDALPSTAHPVAAGEGGSTRLSQGHRRLRNFRDELGGKGSKSQLVFTKPSSPLGLPFCSFCVPFRPPTPPTPPRPPAPPPPLVGKKKMCKSNLQQTSRPARCGGQPKLEFGGNK